MTDEKDKEMWAEINKLKRDLATLTEKRRLIEEVRDTLQDVKERGHEAIEQIERAIETLGQVYGKDD